MEKISYKTCCCCSASTLGRQWWNRDEGYGLCVRCADSIEKKEDAETMENCYGKKGIHYYTEEEING